MSDGRQASTITALVVDDEPIARRELARLLREHPEVEVLGQAGDIADAARQCQTLSPDLMFLDIHMPGGNGFDLLEALDELPRVIFTTAYEHHALRAFEINALDYLLKPIEPARLAAAIERAHTEPAQTASPNTATPELRRVFVRDGERCWFVDLRDIVLFEAHDNVTHVVFGEHRPTIRRTLNYLEGRLDRSQFFRANRSQIVSLRHIQAVEPWFGERLRIELDGGHLVELSRRRSVAFRRLCL